MVSLFHYIFLAKTFIICFIPSTLCFIGINIVYQIFVKYSIVKIISLLLTLLCIISGWITFILNPGIIFNDKNANNNEPKIYCNECKFLYPHLKEKLEHCDKCGVCCFGIDHHCDIFGKCVAKNNLNIFITFSISICLLFIVNFISLAFIF